MEIAVLSDIHGNYVALETCVEYAFERGIENFIFLGDYLGELAYPQRTMQFLYTLKEKHRCWFIKGNKENYWLNYKDNVWKEQDSTTGALYYTYHNLTQRDMDFFRQLTDNAAFSLQTLSTITLCHGSPNKVNEDLLPNDENTFSIMDKNPTDYILCGHTHRQYEVKHNKKVLWNPGSVGMPLDSGGKSQFLILHSTEEASWESELLSIDYDVDKVINDLHTSGLYEKALGWCTVSENVLKTGENSHAVVLNKAMALCKEKTGKCHWPDIPEECWKRAIHEMIGK